MASGGVVSADGMTGGLRYDASGTEVCGEAW
jgi:hypothetical protein